jgi:hypothetical protein
MNFFLLIIVYNLKILLLYNKDNKLHKLFG